MADVQESTEDMGKLERWGEGEGEREVLTVTKQLLFKSMKRLESLVLSNTLNFPFVRSKYYAVF